MRLNEYQDSSNLYENFTVEKSSLETIYRGYEFGCPSNEYVVTFPSKPKIADGSVPFNDSFIKSTTAELASSEYKSFCRAECVNFDIEERGTVDKDYFYDFLNQYSEHTGLSYPSFTYEENKLGKVASVRGFKTLINDSNEEIKVTYYVRVHYVNKSIMFLYVGCPSTDYPTKFISNFL